jgi:signal transduction histidine kinase/DNA-binding response OmpR family regulator
MNPREVHSLFFGPEDGPSTVWPTIAAAAATAGLDALGAVRLGLATSAVVGRRHGQAEVRLARDGGGHHSRVEAVVRGGTGECADIPDGLVDECHRRTATGVAEHVVVVESRAGSDAPLDPDVAALRHAFRQGRDVHNLLGLALAALERLQRRRATDRAELLALRTELEETSRGLIAVYAESSDEMAQVELDRDHAVEASHAKAEYLANMSHEIRSPLSAVTGFTGLLLETNLNAEQAEYAEAIRAAGDHLRGVVDDVLDLSKIEAGRLDLEDIPFDLIGCVEDALGIVAAAAEEKELALAVLFDEDTPHIAGGDPVRIRQILVNLLTNAVKFTAHGEVVVNVETRPRSGITCDLTFHVRDTGIGIAADAIDTIFARYGQAEAATFRTFGGTGLGLAICRQLAQLMGGDLTVRSKVGVGSTFSCAVLLRLVEAKAPDTMLLADRPVLLIHDHPATSEAVRRHLVRWGASVTHYSTVDESLRHRYAWESAAVAIVGATRYSDAVVECARLVSQARQDRRLPVVAVIPLAARHQLGAPSEHIQAAVGMPVRRGQLREAVFAAMGQPQAPAAAGPGPAPSMAPAAVADRADGRPVERAAAPAVGDPATVRHILHVDDDPMLTTLVQRILARRSGVDVLTATHGQTAIELVAQTRVDMILLDLRLPDMTGEDLLRRLRTDERTRDVPIVVLSGDTTPETMTRLVTHGATEYLPKPFTAGQLRGLVDDLIDATAEASGTPST